jgi:signal peptidase I
LALFNANKFLGIWISIAFLAPVSGVAWSGDCLPAAQGECPTGYNMPSASMIPTIFVGDHFSVDTQRFITHWPEMGDVVVFLLKTNNEIRYVKRIVGLPRDRIQMREGVLFINGEAVKRERVEDFVDTAPNGEGGGHPIQQYEETLYNGVKYRVLDEQPGSTGSVDDTDEYVVPAKHYFLMGDNRDNSDDSRFPNSVGYVPRDNIIGQATYIYFSWNFLRIGMKIR